jgi:hypothetical protein
MKRKFTASPALAIPLRVHGADVDRSIRVAEIRGCAEWRFAFDFAFTFEQFKQALALSFVGTIQLFGAGDVLDDPKRGVLPVRAAMRDICLPDGFFGGAHFRIPFGVAEKCRPGVRKNSPGRLEQIPITLKRTLLRRSSWRILVV